MGKKYYSLGMLLVLSILLVGCTKNVYNESQSPSPIIQVTEKSSGSDGREVLVQWLKMPGNPLYNANAESEDDVDETITFLVSWNIKPIEIWQGAVIFYGEGYGYYWMEGYDINYRSTFWKARTVNPQSNFWGDVAKKHGGRLMLAPGGNGEIASFKTLSDARDFVSDLSALIVDYPVKVYQCVNKDELGNCIEYI